VPASCVTAAKFDACSLLSAQMSKSHHFANVFQNTTAKSTYVSRHFLFLTFAANRWIKFGMCFKLVYYLRCTENSRKTVKCALLTPFRMFWRSVRRWWNRFLSVIPNPSRLPSPSECGVFVRLQILINQTLSDSLLDKTQKTQNLWSLEDCVGECTYLHAIVFL
jgi:hypothetical protein